MQRGIKVRLQQNLFRHRRGIVMLFFLITLFLFASALQLRMDASFSKGIPLAHPYMKTYVNYEKDFGSANLVMVAISVREGTIFTPEFFTTFKTIHDQLFFIPGINRPSVQSIFSPSTRFTEVVEDGFTGGPVIPADFEPTPQGLAIVQSNLSKAGIVGRLVANDFSSAMIRANLLEINPQTGEILDTLALAKQLEADIRQAFETDEISIHIIGFSKMMGEVSEGAKFVALFFVIAVIITTLLVYFFCHSIVLSGLALLCSLIAVCWQLGVLPLLGYGLDPLSMLVPFWVFAIGVSHSVQMINATARLVAQGYSSLQAAKLGFNRLIAPGSAALLTDTIGFLTILLIDIGTLKELALTASLGIATLILTHFILLPLLLSYASFTPATLAKMAYRSSLSEGIWSKVAQSANQPVATWVLVIASLLFALSYWQIDHLKIGELSQGAPALQADSRYNQDNLFITQHYAITTDVLSVIIETEEQGCTNYELMSAIDQFQWQLEQVQGVQSTISLASVAKLYNAGFNEGSAKWRVLPRNNAALSQSIAQVATNTGLLNQNCSVIPVYLFLEDHRADTIGRVIDAVKLSANNFSQYPLNFRLAAGPVGVLAAKNEVVASAQKPIVLSVCAAVILLCLITFRSMKATVVVILPLLLVSTLAQALMVVLSIGLTVITLPMIALGIGIGVDYGIYIVAAMREHLAKGLSLEKSYQQAVIERGSAVFFTAITLSAGVSTWIFSPLKFQADMGVLLCFLFLVNMLAAVVVLPALAAWLWRIK